MDRRLVLAGAAALAAMPMTSIVQAQSARGIDADKLPALMGGDFATVTSQMALTKGSRGAIRTFAKLEIAEQAAVATAFGSRPGAAGLDAKHAALVAELEAAEGPAFDAMYIDGQIAGHRELLRIHQRYARSGGDPMARGASLVGVTGIQTHLTMLASIRQQLDA